MNTMKAAVVYGTEDIRLEQVPVPQVSEGSIRIRVEACAICGTDMRIYKKGDYRAQYPVITGHEIAGSVDAVGRGVASVREGDRVCVAPGHGCGECRMCRAGYPNVCLHPHPSLGYKLNGGFAEYMAVPEHIFRLGFVNPIPENLSFQQASMSEITACCINAQDNVQVHPGDSVLILGAGPAGIIHAHLSRLNGADKVYIAQRSPHRLEAIRQVFPGLADRLICLTQEDLFETLETLTGGEGVDAVFVCAPSRQAQEDAVKAAGCRGRINFFGGLPGDDATVHIDANTLHYKELFISGASSSRPETNREALRLLSERRIDPDKLTTHVFALDDIHKGFDVMESRDCIKVVIEPQRGAAS